MKSSSSSPPCCTHIKRVNASCTPQSRCPACSKRQEEQKDVGCALFLKQSHKIPLTPQNSLPSSVVFKKLIPDSYVVSLCWLSALNASSHCCPVLVSWKQSPPPPRSHNLHLAKITHRFQDDQSFYSLLLGRLSGHTGFCLCPCLPATMQ